MVVDWINRNSDARINTNISFISALIGIVFGAKLLLSCILLVGSILYSINELETESDRYDRREVEAAC